VNARHDFKKACAEALRARTKLVDKVRRRSYVTARDPFKTKKMFGSPVRGGMSVADEVF
jgi:hypothetical protein